MPKALHQHRHKRNIPDNLELHFAFRIAAALPETRLNDSVPENRNHAGRNRKLNSQKTFCFYSLRRGTSFPVSISRNVATAESDKLRNCARRTVSIGARRAVLRSRTSGFLSPQERGPASLPAQPLGIGSATILPVPAHGRHATANKDRAAVRGQ